MNGSIYIIRCVVIAVVVLLMAGVAFSLPGQKPSHMDGMKNPEGCAACHSGRGIAHTPLLKKNMNDLCFTCHGSRGDGRARTDVESVLQKKYVHPVLETGNLHRPGEVLPEMSINQDRHVACSDCHAVHSTSEEKPWQGRGFMPGDPKGRDAFVGRRPRSAQKDYELCYLCHSESANLPSGSTNKASEFDSRNESFHPVESPGRNLNVPSLKGNPSVRDTIGCLDCHGNNEPWGAQGPHGSEIKGMLLDHYRQDDGPEGALDYALCYRCHDRQSILRDESFRRHNLHISYKDTACHTCHTPHGSRTNRHLIRFNPAVVTASSVSGGPEYLTGSAGQPKCYLKCHDVDHNSVNVGQNPWPW